MAIFLDPHHLIPLHYDTYLAWCIFWRQHFFPWIQGYYLPMRKSPNHFRYPPLWGWRPYAVWQWWISDSFRDTKLTGLMWVRARRQRCCWSAHVGWNGYLCTNFQVQRTFRKWWPAPVRRNRCLCASFQVQKTSRKWCSAHWHVRRNCTNFRVQKRFRKSWSWAYAQGKIRRPFVALLTLIILQIPTMSDKRRYEEVDFSMSLCQKLYAKEGAVNRLKSKLRRQGQVCIDYALSPHLN